MALNPFIVRQASGGATSTVRGEFTVRGSGPPPAESPPVELRTFLISDIATGVWMLWTFISV